MAGSAGQHDWRDLAQTLADGFESLLKEVEKLSLRERDLDSRLKYAFDEYVKLASDPLLDNEKPKEREAVARKILKAQIPDQVDSEDSVPLYLPRYLDDIDDIRKGFQAFKSIKTKHPKGPPTALRSPVPGEHGNTTSLEQDFTTQGIKGDLGCPFAKKLQQSNGVPTPPQDLDGLDPIAAEFHPELRSLVSAEEPPSVAGTAGKCPIRYLSQHSPEEVAQYFENHKHEIPRSHEICVKRYQKNSESIRELDSKYGNLVSMIQGLGVKHQQYLPNKDGERSIERGPSSTDAVSKWADEVSRPSDGVNGAGIGSDTSPSPAVLDDEDDQRSPRFQRPLREIRVGESPSRPWGISVPLAPDRPLSPETAPVSPLLRQSQASEQRPLDSTLDQQYPIPHPTLKPLGNAKKCPFDFKAGKVSPDPFVDGAAAPKYNGASHQLRTNPQGEPQPVTGRLNPKLEVDSASAHHQDQEQQQPSLRLQSPSQLHSPSQPAMIFNGPVFFGYSAEQAANMMKEFQQQRL